MTDAARGALVRVVFADDHTLMFRGLSREIADTPGFDLVGAAQDGETALRLIREHCPDVALLDIDMPVMGGIDVLKRIVAEHLPTRVLIYTGSVEEAFVYNAITAGAKGYLLKTTAWPDTLAAMRDVASGKTIVDPSMAGALAEALAQRRDESPLNDRERTVLTLTAENLTAKEVGGRMNLSDRMVKKHLRAIYGKLGVATKSAALAEAVRRGIVK